MAKNEIIVYEKPLSLKVLKTFSSLAELEKWIEHDKPSTLDVYADQVSVNGMVMLGWDELGSFLN